MPCLLGTSRPEPKCRLPLAAQSRFVYLNYRIGPQPRLHGLGNICHHADSTCSPSIAILDHTSSLFSPSWSRGTCFDVGVVP
jgi:hypothetical protein